MFIKCCYDLETNFATFLSSLKPWCATYEACNIQLCQTFEHKVIK